MRTWKIRTVRVPLNEQCWLGVSPDQSQYGGTTYQNAVKAYVNLLVSNGITPIVEMHWNYGQYTGPSAGCSDVNATCQKPMPDAQYAPSFWTGVANAFKGNDAVVFDLFNEPYPEIGSDWNKTLGWQCWRDGGICTGLPYETAGMQDLVDAVRGTGATNVLMLGGLEWANDMREWPAHKPLDPLNNIAASWHVYNHTWCITVACYESEVAPIAAQVPVVVAEFGDEECDPTWRTALLDWLDKKQLGYLAWVWNTWQADDCAAKRLVTDYAGTPSAYGRFYMERLGAKVPGGR
jgi:hypothetical protein